MPRQPGRSKRTAENEGGFAYDPAAYLPGRSMAPEPVTVDILGEMRGVRMARVTVSPFSYDAQSNTLTVSGRLTARLSFEGADTALTQTLKTRYRTPEFDPVFRSLESTLTRPRTKDTLSDPYDADPPTYVVVASNAFLARESLQDFITWKRRKGFHVIEADTDVIFSSSLDEDRRNDLKTYLQDLYAGGTPPVYVLFVGDVAEIPAFPVTPDLVDGNHVTDLFYCDFTDDVLPDAYYGRFPASTVWELDAIVEKTLAYETLTVDEAPLATDYLDACLLIAGADVYESPTYANGQIAYLINEYFNVDSGFSQIYAFLYNQNWDWDGTVDTRSTGTTLVTDQIMSRIDEGAGFVNYTGHCDSTGWFNKPKDDYELDSSDIPFLNNADRYGFVVANCCESSRFEQGDAFGEKLVLARNEGAAVYLGAANETFWDEDFYWAVGGGIDLQSFTAQTVKSLGYEDTDSGNFDALFHTHGEPESDWHVTAGQMVFCGNQSVMTHSPDYGPYYVEIYNVLGDPSLSPWLGEPAPLTEPCLDQTFSLSTEPYARVAVSRGDELLESVWTGASGRITLNLSSLAETDTIDLVITKQNRRPYTELITLGDLPETTEPQASFMLGSDPAATPVTVTARRAVTFTDTSTGCPETFAWDIEGAVQPVQTAQHPTVSYADLGLFDVTLSVDNNGVTHTLTRTDYIRVIPSVSFSADRTSVTTGGTVTFTAQTSHPDRVTAYDWSFDGGTPAVSTGANPQVLYDSTGLFSVSLALTVDGVSYPLTRSDYISVSAPSDNKDPNTTPTALPASDSGCFISSAWSADDV
jgi:PKD repeat protein